MHAATSLGDEALKNRTRTFRSTVAGIMRHRRDDARAYLHRWAMSWNGLLIAMTGRAYGSAMTDGRMWQTRCAVVADDCTVWFRDAWWREPTTRGNIATCCPRNAGELTAKPRRRGAWDCAQWCWTARHVLTRNVYECLFT